MTRVRSSKSAARPALRRDRRGSVALVVAASALPLLGLVGLAVDVGRAYATRNVLQASADAAALAGAQDLNSNTAAGAAATALSYSGASGGRNARSDMTITVANGYPKAKCLASTGVLCDNASRANAMVVQQQAIVPTTFGRLFGIDTLTVTATATASSSGGQPKPLDVMLILDTTQSMGTNKDPSCGTNMYRIDCARTGARMILNTLAPSADYIGLMVFPGLTSATAPNDATCSGTVTIAPYTPTPTYQVVGLSSDYRTSDGARTLSSTSSLVSAVGGGGGTCKGVVTTGGVGTYFGDVITAAESALSNSTHTNAQKVIIILSDGDAGSSTLTTTKSGKTTTTTNQCHLAISAAASAANAGTWVYSIAYGAANSGGCSTDSPAVTPCATMQAIASDPAKFYSDNQATCPSGANSVTGLLQAFQAISTSLVAPRLLPNDTI